MITKFKIFEGSLSVITLDRPRVAKIINEDSVIDYILNKLGEKEDYKYLGGYAFGHAYQVGNKVLKLTSDENEFEVANDLSNKKFWFKYLINVYDTRFLTTPTEGYTTETNPFATYEDDERDIIEFPYLILMDYIHTLNRVESHVYAHKMCKMMRSILLVFVNEQKFDTVETFMKYYIDVWGTNTKNWDLEFYERYKDIIHKFIEGWIGMKREANQFGLKLTDAHEKNVGWNSLNNLCHFDIRSPVSGFDPLHKNKFTNSIESGPSSKVKSYKTLELPKDLVSN